MVQDIEVSLAWYEECAHVLWHRNGRVFEIGTVSLDRLCASIVGFTYAHHMLPIFNASHSKTFLGYRIMMGFDRLMVELIKEKVKNLHLRFPEISVKKIMKDDIEDPEFYDQLINVSLGPINIFDFENSEQIREFIQKSIIDCIMRYIQVLGVHPWLEVLNQS